ncbi:hypothetical protein T484DRAFT_3064872 [Baffinella frigidus]|nr:hypothetical protein T484DRAFT_3064872 [Cryptophyta sp. CCMP2293]
MPGGGTNSPATGPARPGTDLAPVPGGFCPTGHRCLAGQKVADWWPAGQKQEIGYRILRRAPRFQTGNCTSSTRSGARLGTLTGRPVGGAGCPAGRRWLTGHRAGPDSHRATVPGALSQAGHPAGYPAGTRFHRARPLWDTPTFRYLIRRNPPVCLRYCLP